MGVRKLRRNEYTATLSIVSDSNKCKSLVSRAKNIHGVRNAFRVEKELPNDVDVIISISGETREEIWNTVRIISNIGGVINVDSKIVKSLLA